MQMSFRRVSSYRFFFKLNASLHMFSSRMPLYRCLLHQSAPLQVYHPEKYNRSIQLPTPAECSLPGAPLPTECLLPGASSGGAEIPLDSPPPHSLQRGFLQVSPPAECTLLGYTTHPQQSVSFLMPVFPNQRSTHSTNFKLR